MSEVLYPKAWFDDKVVDVEDLVMPVPSPSAQYGMALFEGIRGYPREGGVAVVACLQHMKRMYESAMASDLNFRSPIPLGDAVRAVFELMKHNEVRGPCYVRPYLFHQGTGHAALRRGVQAGTHLSIHVERWEGYLPPDGVRCTLSDIPKPMYRHAQYKTSGNYVLCTEAKSEAIHRGFDNCILRDCRGYIAEGASENLFLEMGGCLLEPIAADGPILPGITATILRGIARSMGVEVSERNLTPQHLRAADGILLCGTAAEATHVKEVDGHVYNGGKPTKIIGEIIRRYRHLVNEAEESSWLTYVTT